MRYPDEFSKQAEARVEAAKIRAGKAFDKAKSALPIGASSVEVQQLFKQYVKSIFAAFAHEACELGKRHVWKVAEVDFHVHSFLRVLVIQAHFEKGYDTGGSSLPQVVSNMDGSILPQVLRAFKASDEWKAYEQERLEVAELQSVEDKPRGFDLVRRAAQQLSSVGPKALESSQDFVEVYPTDPTPRKRHFREPNLELLKNPEATLNRQNAAEALGVSERTLDRWVTDGEIVPTGPGLRKRFKIKDLLRLVNRKKRDKVDKARQE